MFDTLIILPSILLISLFAAIHYLAHQSFLRSSQSSTESNSTWNIERSGLVLSLWTSSLNDLPRSILNRLNIKLARRLKIIYNSGIGFGLLGMIFALGASVWATWLVWSEVWYEIGIHTLEKVSESLVVDQQVESTSSTVREIVKRALEDNSSVVPISTVPQLGSRDFAGGLQPLIPGLTMPWTHLPTLVLALVINQLIHEFGHAISAALDDIQPSRFSLSLHAGIPSMMVSFPHTIDTLDANAKMRLATSGPFHNLLTWFFLWLLTFGGIGNLFWYDRSGDGRVVQDVHWNSPLYAHLPIGSLITHLDDIPLSTSTSSPGSDPWTEYLLSDKVGDEGRGWCMDKTIFLSQPEPGPAASPLEGNCNTNSTSKITFESVYGLTKGQSRCLTPRPILNIKSTKCPCPDTRWVCIRPKAVEQVLRIGISSKASNMDGNTKGRGTGNREVDQQVVLYTGPREQVWRDVRVSNKDARGWKGGVRFFELFFKYISTISLSLFLFNLLPLPLTDGSQLLISLLQWKSVVQPSVPLTSVKATIDKNTGDSEGTSTGPTIGLYRQYEMDSDEEDEEEYIGSNEYTNTESTVRRSGRGKEGVFWKRWARRLIQWFTLLIVGLWSLGWGMVFLLRSS